MFAYLFEVLALGVHIILYLADGLDASLLCGDEVSGRIYRNLFQFIDERTSQRVYDGDLLHLVAEELDSYGVLAVAYAYVHSVSADPECSSFELRLSP